MKPIHLAAATAAVIAAFGAGCDRPQATTRGHVAQIGPDASYGIPSPMPEGGYGRPNPMPGSPIADAAPSPSILPPPSAPGQLPAPGGPPPPY
jgi:hypothetical protein